MKQEIQANPGSLRDAFIVRLPLFYVFLSGLGFSLQNLVVKVLEEQYQFKGSFQCVFARGMVQMSVSALIIYTDKERQAGHGHKLFGDTPFVSAMLFMRAFLGYFGIAFSFLAVEYIAIGDSSVLVMMSPVIAALAGFAMLGEPWRLPEFIATMLAMTGAVLVAKPPFLFGSADESASSSTAYFWGVLFSLVAAFGAGFAYVFVRILGTSAKMPWAYVCFSQAIAQIVMSVPNMYLFHQQVVLSVRWEIYLLITIGACIGCVSQIAMTVGMQREKSATASAMRTSDVVFGFIWQALFTTDPVSMLSVGGAALVSLGIVIIVVSKQTDPPPATVTALTDESSEGLELSPIHHISNSGSGASSPSSSSSSSSPSKLPRPAPAKGLKRILTAGLRRIQHSFANKAGNAGASGGLRGEQAYSRLAVSETADGIEV